MTEIDHRAGGAGGGRLRRWLSAPVDVASLAAFRVLFGLLLAAAMVRFLAKGWVLELYVLPKFLFCYDGLSWIRPLPATWMHAHFVFLALLGLMVAAGFCYRAAMLLFCIGFAYIELLDQTTYLNHYYFVSLLCCLMIFMPANRAWSVDVRLKPAFARSAVPAWTIHLLRFQLGVVYFFAGCAKVNSDWLLQAQPLRIWLAARNDAPWIGSWLQPEWVAYAASWFGAIYDLTIVPFLLHHRTRRLAFCAVIVFHVATWLLFNIGMFPWIMIMATTVFFRPGWPRGLLTGFATRLSSWWPALAAKCNRTSGPKLIPHQLTVRRPRLLFSALTLYALVQILLPLRPYFFGDGHPAWSYRGFNLAWQVMVAEKTGYVEFDARDPVTGRRARIRARDYLTPRQEVLMAQDPFLIRVLARKISADLRDQGWVRPRIFVNAFATINGRPSQRIIDPEVDLAEASGAGWVLPLVQNRRRPPLERQW